jgi:hypothetical protein
VGIILARTIFSDGGEGKAMVFSRYRFDAIRVFVYFIDPSGQASGWSRGMYDVDEQEYAKLNEAVAAFQAGSSTEKFHVMRLKNGHEVTLNLSEVDEVIRESEMHTLARL